MIIEREFRQSRDELTGRPINLPTGKLILKDDMGDTELEKTKKMIWPELYDNPDGWPVLWEGKLYYGIERFDCVVVDLFTEPTKSGGYFTVIPISSVEFRRDNPTKAKVLIVNRGEWAEFTIWDDWGEGHVMKIHNSLSAEISSAIEGAKRNEIPISPRPMKDLLVKLRECAPEYVASEGNLYMAAGLMWGNNLIDSQESWEIVQYLMSHKPDELKSMPEDGWPKGELELRLEFLDKLINKLKEE